jgi:hypothetical protein
MSSPLEQRLEGIYNVLMGHVQAGTRLSSASRGREREIFIEEFLQKVFPPAFRFGTGDIVDSKGRKSGQVDIVVERPYFPSLPTPASDVRLYLAEGVAAVIEVKSDVRRQWSQVERTTREVKKLVQNYRRLIRAHGVLIAGPAGTSFRIPAYAVGYVGHKTIRGLARRMEHTDEDARPDGVLVLESRLFVTPSRTFDGCQALYMFIMDLNDLLNNLILRVEINHSGYFDSWV